jgi:hypothetical protein
MDAARFSGGGIPLRVLRCSQCQKLDKPGIVDEAADG